MRLPRGVEGEDDELTRARAAHHMQGFLVCQEADEETSPHRIRRNIHAPWTTTARRKILLDWVTPHKICVDWVTHPTILPDSRG